MVAGGILPQANDELIATAEIGEEARRFLESDLGQCLLGMADQEIAAAQEALLTVVPMDFEGIRKLQNQAQVALYFKQWLAELVDKGNSAIEVFKQQNQ